MTRGGSCPETKQGGLLFRLFSRRPGPVFCLASAAVLLCAHAALWGAELHLNGKSPLKALEYWDGAWYSGIILRGYEPASRAFFPLYPLCVKALSALTAMPALPQVAGTLFSSALFLLLCLFVGGRAAKNGEAGILAPQSVWGWLFFLLWPGSYIFHSHHTESLFLLLSWLALKDATDGRSLRAPLLAGLSALTRVQGSLVCAAVAAVLAARQTGKGRMAAAFASSGLISGAGAAIYPLYLFYDCGDMLAFLAPHLTWTHPTATPQIFANTFVMANPWQTAEFKWLLRQFAAFVMIAGAALAWTRRGGKIPALYAAASLMLMPVQGEFANIFRFGAVLFPALFSLGDGAGKKLSPIVRTVLFAGLLALNLLIAREYILSRWAY